MSPTRIKICGVRDVETARVAYESGAWAIGLVFVEQSPRCVSVEAARRIVASLPAGVVSVGLFVDAAADAIRKTVDDVGLKLVQLHGRETPELVSQLNPLRVIKAVTTGDMSPWRGMANLEALLFDTPPAADATLPGGSGRAFDWTALAAMKSRGDLQGLPQVILAGGLTPANVGDAIMMIRPDAVDVSGGVESSRGVKDPALIRAFCDAVRKADATIQRGTR